MILNTRLESFGHKQEEHDKLVVDPKVDSKITKGRDFMAVWTLANHKRIQAAMLKGTSSPTNKAAKTPTYFFLLNVCQLCSIFVETVPKPVQTFPWCYFSKFGFQKMLLLYLLPDTILSIFQNQTKFFEMKITFRTLNCKMFRTLLIIIQFKLSKRHNFHFKKKRRYVIACCNRYLPSQ